MFAWAPYYFLRYFFFLVGGVLLQFHLAFKGPFYSYSMLILAMLYVLVFRFSQGARYRAELLGIIALLWVFNMGLWRTQSQQKFLSPQHFFHQKNIQAYWGYLKEEGKRTDRYSRQVLALQGFKTPKKWVKSQSRLLIYFQKDSLNPHPPLPYGSLILIKGAPDSFQDPKTPGAFNFKAYWESQHIEGQDFIRPNEYIILSKPDDVYTQVIAYSKELRLKALEELRDRIQAPREQGSAAALLLGYKGDLMDESRSDFSEAGLMHILAVSGLHVGIILLLVEKSFIFLLSFRQGKYIRFILSILALLSYAALTGFSPSVLRATWMFSILLLGKLLDRSASIYNSLGLSAFALIIYDPYLLFSLSFQLSYLAVLGIVYLDQKVQGSLRKLPSLLRFFASLMSVSLAAQLATAPLSIYYFHQFPNYFLIANILVLPWIGALLILGVIFLISLNFPFLSEIICPYFESALYFLNELVAWISALPGSSSQNLSLSTLELFLVYSLLLGLLLLFKYRAYSYALLSGLSLFFLSVSFAWGSYQIHTQSVLRFFYQARKSNLILQKGRNIWIEGDFHKTSADYQYILKPFLAAQGIGHSQKMRFDSLKLPTNLMYLEWEGKTIGILSKPFPPSTEVPVDLRIDYLIIRQNAFYALHAIPTNSFEKVIIDNSNNFRAFQKYLSSHPELQAKIYSLEAQSLAFSW